MHFLEHAYGCARQWHSGLIGPGSSQWLKLPIETCSVEAGSLVERKHAAHEIGQFADVAGPAVSLQAIQEARLEQGHRSARLRSEFFSKVPGQQGNIFAALP